MATTVAPARRGRPRKIESIADWMARIDKEVDEAARKIERKPPTYASLNPAQKRIVELLIEHLRRLPELERDEDFYEKYWSMNVILTELFKEKYPAWLSTSRSKYGRMDPKKLPDEEGKNFRWLLRNCACLMPPPEREILLIVDDD
jgi:hypothetical protein